MTGLWLRTLKLSLSQKRRETRSNFFPSGSTFFTWNRSSNKIPAMLEALQPNVCQSTG